MNEVTGYFEISETVLALLPTQISGFLLHLLMLRLAKLNITKFNKAKLSIHNSGNRIAVSYFVIVEDSSEKNQYLVPSVNFKTVVNTFNQDLFTHPECDHFEIIDYSSKLDQKIITENEKSQNGNY